MPFDKFVDMETLSEERRRAVRESLQSMNVSDLRKVVKELSDFEGDPWQANFVRAIDAHPEASFYRAVTQEGAIILYCPGEDTGVKIRSNEHRAACGEKDAAGSPRTMQRQNLQSKTQALRSGAVL